MPGAAPLASQASQATAVRTVTSVSQPDRTPLPGTEAATEAAAEKRVEQVAQAAEGVASDAAGGAVVAEAVVAGAALRVGEGLVGGGGLLEAALGLGVAGVGVGVEIAGQPPVGLLDLVGRRVPADAEHLVVVAGHGRLLSPR